MEVVIGRMLDWVLKMYTTCTRLVGVSWRGLECFSGSCYGSIELDCNRGKPEVYLILFFFL